MKKPLLAVALIFVFLLLGSGTGLSAAVEKVVDKVATKLVLAVRLAQLYTKEPDQKLAMPVDGIQKSAIANTWHAPRDGSRLHQGQDIFAPRGTAVRSATEGYVASIGNNSLGGQTVSVIGAGGRLYYYAHLDSYAPGLKEGDFVDTKTILGYVGTTGNAAGTPPHLHFGVYEPKGATNPLPLLSDRETERAPSAAGRR